MQEACTAGKRKRVGADWVRPGDWSEQYRLVIGNIRYKAFFRDSVDDAEFMGLRPVVRGLRLSTDVGGHMPFLIASESRESLDGYMLQPGATSRVEGSQVGFELSFTTEEDVRPFNIPVSLHCKCTYLEDPDVFVGTWKRKPQNGYENGGILIAEVTD